MGKAFVEELQGNTVETEMAYKRAIELSPGNDRAYRNLATFYADLGRHDEARRAYQDALGLRPGLWNNHYTYGDYLRIFTDDTDDARRHLEQAAELHPSGVGPKMALGNLSLSRGKLRDAETWYRQALEYRQTPWSHYNLGVVYYYRGEFELALRNFQAALERYPNRPSFQVATGDALRQLGQNERAQSYYQQALATYRGGLEDDPHDSENRSKLAALLATLELCEEALQELESVLTQDPDSPKFSSMGAYTAVLCGDMDRATRLGVTAIRGGEVLYSRFHPSMEPLREVPEVRQALEDAGLPLP
jgi:tetratricopeptide (TPR) repeat protein